jgi:hypothetical protein
MPTSPTREASVGLFLLGFTSHFPCKKHVLPSSETWRFCMCNWIVIYIMVLCVLSNYWSKFMKNSCLKGLLHYFCIFDYAILLHYPLKRNIDRMSSQKRLSIVPICSYAPLCLASSDSVWCLPYSLNMPSCRGFSLSLLVQCGLRLRSSGRDW